MVVFCDLATAQASITGIDWHARRALFNRLLAIQRFRQGARHGFQFGKLTPGEEISMRKASTLKAALQQLNNSLLSGKICE
jgi:hypothetical protein